MRETGLLTLGKTLLYLFLGFIAWINLPIPHEWAKNSYECPEQCKNASESITN